MGKGQLDHPETCQNRTSPSNMSMLRTTYFAILIFFDSYYFTTCCLIPCIDYRTIPWAILPRPRVLTHPVIQALLRLRLIIQTSLLSSYMCKSAWSTGRVNISLPPVVVCPSRATIYILRFKFGDIYSPIIVDVWYSKLSYSIYQQITVVNMCMFSSAPVLTIGQHLQPYFPARRPASLMSHYFKREQLVMFDQLDDALELLQNTDKQKHCTGAINRLYAQILTKLQINQMHYISATKCLY